MPRSDPHALDAFIFEVFRLNGALAAAGDALTEPLGLTSARWQVLGSLQRSGGATVAEMARNLCLARQSVQRIVNELLEERYVELMENPRHKRAKKIVLTKKGEQSHEAISSTWTPIAEEISKHFGPVLLTTTARLLAELRDEFRNVTAAAESASNKPPPAKAHLERVHSATPTTKPHHQSLVRIPRKKVK
jgi:DNA-binding MarR family transcriptional regulator